ncbi:hypothetical protein FB451DRAFT_1512674 [Mycena latifolia]|nr:hypothetical protein FB451DRAFT_1512674 [Mycena latifolia]
MPSFWSSSPYQPVAQESEKLLYDSGSESDLPTQVQVQATLTGGQWMGRALLVIAAANVLIALGTLLATRDISALSIPIAAVDISALPRPDPYVGLKDQPLGFLLYTAWPSINDPIIAADAGLIDASWPFLGPPMVLAFCPLDPSVSSFRLNFSRV